MNKLLSLFIVSVICVVSGCASIQVANRQNELKAKLDPLLGKTQQEVVIALGPPKETSYNAGIEVYKYYQSYGTRSNALAYGNPYAPYSAFGAGKTWEAYDTIIVYFKDGIMIKWDMYVQR